MQKCNFRLCLRSKLLVSHQTFVECRKCMSWKQVSYVRIHEDTYSALSDRNRCVFEEVKTKTLACVNSVFFAVIEGNSSNVFLSRCRIVSLPTSSSCLADTDQRRGRGHAQRETLLLIGRFLLAAFRLGQTVGRGPKSTYLVFYCGPLLRLTLL